MNVNLKKTWGWYGGLVYENQLVINQWTFELSLLTVSNDRHQQNIAYERMRYFINEILDDSIMIWSGSEKLESYQNTGARLIVLPAEPVDQIVGIMLYLKLNSIMENRMVVTQTEIWSDAGDNTSYIHSHGEEFGPLAEDGWWLDHRPIWYETIPPSRQDKVVNLDQVPKWKDYDLHWDDKETGRDSVVFANFNKDENK